MGLEELRQKVRSKIPRSEKYLADGPLPDAAITQIYAEVEAEGQPDGSDDELYRRVLSRIRKLAGGAESVELPLKATDRLFGKALVKALAPKIEDLRRKKFGSPDPPFETAENTAEWVEQTSKTDLAEWREESEGREKARAEIGRLADTYRIEIEEKVTLLPYQKPGDEHVKWAPTVPGTYLCQLAEETRRIATRCGVPQAALVTHVLTGLEPARSRARITTKKNWYTLPSGKQIGVNEAVVVFYARDLTEKELGIIYKGVRSHVGGKGTKGMEDKDEAILELVQRLDGPPQEHGSKGPFWEKALKYWNREHPDDTYGTPDSLRMRYHRGFKRLGLP